MLEVQNQRVSSEKRGTNEKDGLYPLLHVSVGSAGAGDSSQSSSSLLKYREQVKKQAG